MVQEQARKTDTEDTLDTMLALTIAVGQDFQYSTSLPMKKFWEQMRKPDEDGYVSCEDDPTLDVENPLKSTFQSSVIFMSCRPKGTCHYMTNQSEDVNEVCGPGFNHSQHQDRGHPWFL